MYLVVIAWLYVVLMMAVAEATNTTGTVLGALITLVLYGAAPVALVVYLMGSPARRKALRDRERAENAAHAAAAAAASPAPSAAQPDAGSQAPADAVATVRKEP
jgi:hypothetical protein